MKLSQKVLLASVFVAALPAQTVINGGRTITGAWDASGAALTKPVRVGSAVPGNCSAGELFFNTAAAAGQNIYLCQPSNVWTQLNGVSANTVLTNQANTFTAAQTFQGKVDAAGASATFPAQTGAALPGTCAVGQLFLNTAAGDPSRMLYVCSAANTWTQAGYQQGTTVQRTSSCTIGQMYFATDATAGQNLYLCTAANTWTRVSGSGSGGSATSYALTMDGSTTALGDGSTVTWSCGSGNAAQCTTTWTIPSGVNWVRVRAIGAGGGGGGQNGTSVGQSGGGGGGSSEAFCPVTPGANVTIAVGVGGTGSSSYIQSFAGGASSFGTCLTVTGGQGGGFTDGTYGGYRGWGGATYSSVAALQHFGWISANGLTGTTLVAADSAGACTSGTAGGVPVRPDGGGCGGPPQTTTNGAGIAAGNAVWGGGGGGGAALGTNSTTGLGGTGVFAGAGGNGGASGTHCTAGTAPGGGGGAAYYTLDANGCSGARGEVRVYYTR